VSHSYRVEVDVSLLGHVLNRSHARKHFGRGNFCDCARLCGLLFASLFGTSYVFSVVLLVSKEVFTAGEMSLKHKHNGQKHLRSIFHVNTLEFVK